MSAFHEVVLLAVPAGILVMYLRVLIRVLYWRLRMV